MIPGSALSYGHNIALMRNQQNEENTPQSSTVMKFIHSSSPLPRPGKNPSRLTAANVKVIHLDGQDPLFSAPEVHGNYIQAAGLRTHVKVHPPWRKSSIPLPTCQGLANIHPKDPNGAAMIVIGLDEHHPASPHGVGEIQYIPVTDVKLNHVDELHPHFLLRCGDMGSKSDSMTAAPATSFPLYDRSSREFCLWRLVVTAAAKQLEAWLHASTSLVLLKLLVIHLAPSYFVRREDYDLSTEFQHSFTLQVVWMVNAVAGWCCGVVRIT